MNAEHVTKYTKRKHMTTKNIAVADTKTTGKEEMEFLELQLKRLEIEERQRNLEYNQSLRLKCEEDRLNLDKIGTLNFLLTSAIVDLDRTIIGSESAVKPVFVGMEEDIIRMKILEIVERL